MSMMDPEQQRKLRKSNDWFTQLVKELCYIPMTKTELILNSSGKTSEKTVPLKRKQFCRELMFTLALHNGVPESKIHEYQALPDNSTLDGRIRMALGNSLRAVARRQKGLRFYDVFYSAPQEFLDKPVRVSKNLSVD